MIKVLFFILAFITSLSASSQYILLLHSYNKGLVWSDNISKGFEDALKPLGKYELSTEYLDVKRNKNSQYYQLIKKAFIEKFKNQTFDIVVAADNAAVDFVLQNRALFKGAPLVFTGIEEMAPGIDIQAVLDDKISLILEHKPFKSNIDGILQMIPNLEYLYVINDKTYTSQMINEILEHTLEQFKNRIQYKLYLNGDLDQIKRDFDKLPKNSAVWFGNLYLDDQENYIPFQKVRALLQSSKFPVFAMTDYHLGKGIVGGHLLRGYFVGNEAGKKAVDILQGKSVDYSQPVLAQTQWVYDYEVLKKFNLDKASLPKEAILINQPKTFFENNRVWIDRAFLIFPFVLVFLIIALVNIYQRYKLSKRLIAQNKREQVLLNTIKSPIFWIDIHGSLRGYNHSFLELFLKDKSRTVIGEKICEILKPYCSSLTKESLSKEEEIEFKYNHCDYIAHSKTYYDESGNNSGTVTIITDMTEKKQLEINKQFIIQQSKLTEVGEMLSAIVHQWKVPLVELSVVAHKMQRYYKKEKLKESDMDGFFDTIMKQIIYMGNTIDEFRQFIKPSNKPVEFDINNGIQEIQTILEASMGYNNIELTYDNQLEGKYTLVGYPNEFKQVLLNIINNAKDSIIASRSRKKSGHIHIVLTREADWIKIEVMDDGKGFEEDSIAHIFEAFYSTKRDGDGFGLYMAKLIIKNKMNGTILASNTDNGAKIEIALPLLIEKETE